MPFGGFKDFSECEAKIKARGNSAESAKRICGSIKAKTEGKKMNDDNEVILLSREEFTLGGVEGFKDTFQLATSNPDLSNDTVELDVMPLTEGTWNKVFYSHAELEKAHKGLSNQALTIDHSKSIRDIVGMFGEATYDKGIHTNATISDPHIKRLFQQGHAPHLGVSVELFGKRIKNKAEKRFEMTQIKFLRASLVLDPACPNDACKVEPVGMSALSDKELTKLEQADLNDLLYEELVTKCEKRFMLPGGKKGFKKRFPGCIEAMRTCRGLDTKHATVMCNFIINRSGGKGKPHGSGKSKPIKDFHSREDFDEFVNLLFADYEQSEDKDIFIKKLQDINEYMDGGNEMSAEDVKNYLEEHGNDDEEVVGKKKDKKKDKKKVEGEDVKEEETTKQTPEELRVERLDTEVEILVNSLEAQDESIDVLEKDIVALNTTLENCSKVEAFKEIEGKVEELEEQLKVYREQILNRIKRANKKFDEKSVDDWDVKQLSTLADTLETASTTGKRQSFAQISEDSTTVELGDIKSMFKVKVQ